MEKALAVAAEPQAPVPGGEEGARGPDRERVAHRFALHAAHAVGRADPESAGRILDDPSPRVGQIRGPDPRGEDVQSAIRLHAADPVACRQPEHAPAVHEELPDAPVPPALGEPIGQALHLASPDSEKVGAERRDPECPVGCLGQRAHRALDDRGGVGGVEHREARPVEASEAALGSDPDVAVSCLAQRQRESVGEPALLVPDPDDVLLRRLVGIQSEQLRGDEQTVERRRDRNAAPVAEPRGRGHRQVPPPSPIEGLGCYGRDCLIGAQAVPPTSQPSNETPAVTGQTGAGAIRRPSTFRRLRGTSGSDRSGRPGRRCRCTGRRRCSARTCRDRTSSWLRAS
jgi:hypothetical protein